jgi:hypothetical protein
MGLSIAHNAKKSGGVRRIWKYAAITSDEGNAVDGPFSATCQTERLNNAIRILL